MQRQGITVVKILLINGQQIPGLLKFPEAGPEEDAIEVPEQGFTGVIGSGQRKLKVLDVEYLIKRDSITLGYHLDWDASSGEERDVVLLHTDKTGDPANAFMREIFESCGLGPIRTPDFDQASRKFAQFKVSYFPRKYTVQKL